MGCDIHWCLEVKTTAGWLGILQNLGSGCEAADRHYRFFAELADVRSSDVRSYGEGVYPALKGLPEDISQLARYAQEIGNWDHSHSWCTLAEFVAAYNRAAGPHREKMSAAKLFGFSYWPLEEKDDVRVVFAFDN